MKVILFGATGMVGQGVLRECLLAPDVDRVLVVGRRPSGVTHEKVVELVHSDFSDFAPVEGALSGYDACFFCLGVSSAGTGEAEYTRVTHDFTLAAASALARVSEGMTFIYVSGAGTDSSERGRSMWARVKGRTENALLRLPFKAACMFRPAFIQPMHGIVSRTRSYRVLYAVARPLYPILRWLAPGWVTTTEKVGKAMLHVARHGVSKAALESSDINALAVAAG
jgi:uncharacterized protein YbjT (DUF2867 family)